MRVEVDENSNIILKDVYNTISLETNSNEKIYICMRDSGFEFNYDGVSYEAKNGVVQKL